MRNLWVGALRHNTYRHVDLTPEQRLGRDVPLFKAWQEIFTTGHSDMRLEPGFVIDYAFDEWSTSGIRGQMILNIMVEVFL